MIVDNSTFVDVWRQAKSVHEVANATGLTYNAVLTKVFRLRQGGYPLKPMREQRQEALDAKFDTSHPNHL